MPAIKPSLFASLTSTPGTKAGLGRVRAVWVAAVLATMGCSLPMVPTKVAVVSPDIPRDLIPVTVDAGLKAVEDPATQARIARLLASPATKAAEREIVAGIIDGSVATLGEPERAERAGQLAARYVAGLVRGFTTEVASGTTGAESEARGGKKGHGQGEIQRFVASVTAAGVQPIVQGFSDARMGEAMSSALTQELGPALQKVLRENVGPGLAQALANEELRKALGATARVVAHEMVVGGTEAATVKNPEHPTEESSLLGRAKNLATKGTQLVGFVDAVLVALVLGLLAWGIKLFMQAKRYRADADEREAKTRFLDEARQASDGKPWSGELLAALEARLRDEKRAQAVAGARPERPKKKMAAEDAAPHSSH